jgi:glycosyltransferase involved in cell wall biosynthesis/O-antigen/teichoic acid export membrane protein
MAASVQPLPRGPGATILASVAPRPPPPAPAGFTRRGLLTSTFALGVRQAVVAGLTALGVLVLSHVLAPAQFAYFGWTLAVMTFVAAVGDLGYGAALIRSGQARRLAGAALAAQGRRLLPVAALAAAAILVVPLAATVRTAALLLVVCAAFLAAQAVPTAVFEAEGRFAAVGLIEVVQRALLVAGAVALAEVSGRGWATPAAGAVAAAAGFALALVVSRVDPRRRDGADSLDRAFSRSWLQGRLANQLGYAVYPLVGTAFLSSRQLGLVLWALSVSALPALGGQLAARILFPALSVRLPAAGVAVHRRAVCLLLAAGGPVASAMLVFAHPLTRLVFGRAWLDGVVVLQLECATTVLGLILTPTAPVLYLVAPAGRARTLMVGYAAGTVALALALIGPVGLIAMSLATLAACSVALVAGDAVLRRAGHPGLGFVLGGLGGLAALTALGLWWAPAVDSGPGLALALLGWGALALAVIGAGLGLHPPVSWSVASRHTGGSPATARLGLHPPISRSPRVGRAGAALLLAAGAATVLLGGALASGSGSAWALGWASTSGSGSGSGEIGAAWWVTGGFVATAAALAALRAPLEAPILGLLLGVYVGVSAVLAAAHPARPELAGAGPGIAPHVFGETLLLAGAGGLACLAGLLLAAGRRRPRRGAPARLERRRLAQAARLLVIAGVAGAALAVLRFLVARRAGPLSTATLQSFWHGGAYLILLAQFAIPGFGLELSLRLADGEPRRRVLAPLVGLAAMMALSLGTGERGFLIEGGLVVGAVALAHRRSARLLVVPALLAGLLLLGVTQAARDALHREGTLAPAAVARHLSPGDWVRLLENQFASFQWGADLDAYGSRIHATNPLVALLAKPIPRQLDPGKPPGLSQRFTEVVYPSAARVGVHFAVPLYAELAYAAGPAGELAGLLVLGGLLGAGWRRSTRWPAAVRPVARAGFLWGAFVLLRGDLSNSVPAAAAWLVPLAFVLWWARVASPRRVILDALAVPARYSGVGETVRRIGASLGGSPLPAELVVRCPADVRELALAWFPPGTAVECPLAASRPVWRRLVHQLAVAPARDRRSSVVVSASELAAPWGRARRVVVVHDLRRLVAPSSASRLERLVYARLVPRAVAGADEILAVSGVTAASLRATLDPACPVTVVAPHHGLRLRARPAAGPGAPVVVVGAVRGYKGLDTVVAALESLAPGERPAVSWAGAVELGADAAAALRARGARVGLELRGWVGEVELAALLDGAVALLAPSRVEGYGLSVLEGLRRGKPVLASDIPAHREIAAGAAVYFAAGDPVALAARLGALARGELDLPARSSASAARGAELARDGPSWAEALAAVLARLAQAPEPARPGGERDGAGKAEEDAGVYGEVDRAPSV